MSTFLPELPDLGAQFAAEPLSLWREAAEAALKGADFEKTLYTRTLEGLRLQPLYTAADMPLSLDDGRRSVAPGWQIAQEIFAANAEELAAAVQSDASQGLEALCLDLDDFAPSRRELQTALGSASGLALHLSSREPLAALLALETLQPSTGSVCCDGLAELVRRGHGHLPGHFDALAELFGQLPANFSLGLDATVYAEAGAHAAQELAYAGAGLVETLQALQTRGIAPASYWSRAQLRLSSGTRFFMEIAKFRALRILLARIGRAYGLSGLPRIQARTARLTLTRFDAHSNFLRQSVAALAAVLGGAGILTTGTFAEAAGPGDAFGRRLARNLQLILRHEVKLDRLRDPVGGSYFLERLTSSLAEAAWRAFQQIEAGGGLLRSLEQNLPQQAVQATAAERQRQVDTRRQLLVGTTAYVNPAESLEPQQQVPLAPSAEQAPLPVETPVTLAALRAAYAAGAAWPSLLAALEQPATSRVTPLPPQRLAAGFEALRLQAALQAPGLTLLALNTLAEARPRLEFSRGLFEIAGLQPDVVPTLEAAVAAQPDIVVLCGTDAAYADQAAGLASRLRQQLPQAQIGLAGRPGDREADWRAAGIDFFVFLGCDAHALLAGLLSPA